MSNNKQKHKIWDIPIRIFHIFLLVGIFAMLGSGFGGAIEIHMQIGKFLFGLILFRILWGLFGSNYANFFKGFIHVVWRNKYDGYGHTRMGWLSVFAILGLISAQIILGLFSTTDEILAGPWAKYISYDLARKFNFVHGEIIAKLIIIMIIVHICAVLYYFEKKNPEIVKAMIHGKQSQQGENIPNNVQEHWVKFAFIAMISAGISFWLFH